MIDLSDKIILQSFLARIGLKKSLGQHFLVDRAVFDAIIEAGDLSPNDTVLEIGAGVGSLSQRLGPLVKKLISVEIDQRFFPLWKEVMAEFPSAKLIEADIRHVETPNIPYKVLANIPYYLTSPLLTNFLRHQTGIRPQVIVFLMQKEVAQRIVDDRKRTLLFWEVAIFGVPLVIGFVSKNAFFPPPKVDSAVLRIRVYEKPLIEARDLTAFFALLSMGFSQPRKTLLNNLLASGRFSKEKVVDALRQISDSPSVRAHELDLAAWKKMFSLLSLLPH